MKKLELAALLLVTASTLSASWAAPAEKLTPARPSVSSNELPPPPPPPPPPPAESNKAAAGNLANAITGISNQIFSKAKDIRDKHKAFVDAEHAYLAYLTANPGTYKSETDPEKNRLKTQMDNAATTLNESFAALKRLINRMDKDVISPMVKGEVQEVQQEVGGTSKRALPQKNQKELMQELTERLQKRQETLEDDGGDSYLDE